MSPTLVVVVLTATLVGILFGVFVLGEFLIGWFFRMGTLIIKPGSRRGRSRRE